MHCQAVDCPSLHRVDSASLRQGLPRRPRLRGLLASAVLSAGLAGAAPAQAVYKPRVAVVQCEESYTEDWYYSQGSSQGLVGLAGLVGVPYETLTLTEFLASQVSRYTSVWFARCQYVNSSRIAPLATRLGSHVAAGGSVFLDAPLGIAYRDASGAGKYRSMAGPFPYLGITDGPWQPLPGGTVRTSSSTHKVALRFGLPAATPLTQGLGDPGIETFELTSPGAPGNEVLLEMTPAGGGAAVPYLVVSTATGGARVLAAGSYSASGVATPFRNEPPAGFYDNRLLPYLVEALAWLVGPENEPFVGLQLSHAPMTVVGRLDGDVSEDAKAVQATADYLVDLGKRTGVTTLYGVVSSLAASGGTFSLFRASGPVLQKLGGSIGSHSRSHPNDMSATLSSAGWTAEVAGSLQDLRSGLTGNGFVPDAYAFINPGETIRSEHYGRFFAAIDLFMTHGFENTVPYATGVLGFGLPAGVGPKPVINNVASPDFQWLFFKDWNYTVAAAAEAQKKTLAWFQERVGRGVLYNEMWHDYGIGESIPPLYHPQERPRPLYDVNSAHFEQNRIYAPAVHELIGKLYLAQGTQLTSAMSGEELRVTLDTSALPAAYRDDASGMGLRVNASSQPIAAVTLNGAPYPAFSADTVVLPPLAATQELGIRFGAPAAESRLTYISKAFTGLVRQGETLTVTLRQPGLRTKFCFAGSPAHVVLQADAFRRSGQELCGELRYGTATAAVAVQHLDTGETGLHVTAAERPITAASWSAPTLTLTLAAGPSGQLELESSQLPESITVNGQLRGSPGSAGPFSIQVAEGAASAVIIRMPAPAVTSPPVSPSGLSSGDSGEAVGCACSTTWRGRASLGALGLIGLLAALSSAARARRRRAA